MIIQAVIKIWLSIFRKSVYHPHSWWSADITWHLFALSDMVTVNVDYKKHAFSQIPALIRLYHPYKRCIMMASQGGSNLMIFRIPTHLHDAISDLCPKRQSKDSNHVECIFDILFMMIIIFYTLWRDFILTSHCYLLIHNVSLWTVVLE